MQNFVVNGVDLEMTLACNLKCSYCYARIDQDQRERGTISEETLLDTIELIKKYGKPNKTIQNGRTISATHIRFYGGEPMVVWDRVKFFVEKVKESGLECTFTIMTNGTIMTEEQVAYIKANKMNVQRSVDGCAEAQAITRPNSIDSYDRVSEILKDYGSTRRMTVMPETAHLIMKSVRELMAKGFDRGFSIMPNYYVKWTKEQEDEFLRQLWEFTDFYIENFKKGKFIYQYYFSREAACRLGWGSTQYGCGAGKGLHCVTWDGYIMSCHRFANEKRDGDFCFGHIKEVLNETAKGYGEIVLDRMEEVKAKKYPEKCRNCVAEVGCEKGCYHANWMCKGNLTEPPDFYCRIRQESAKQVTYADIRLKHIDPLWFTKGNPRVEAKLYLAKIKGGNNNGNNNNQTRRFYVQGYLTEVRGNDNFQRGNTNQNRQGTGTFRRTQGNTNPGGSTGEMRFCQ